VRFLYLVQIFGNKCVPSEQILHPALISSIYQDVSKTVNHHPQRAEQKKKLALFSAVYLSPTDCHFGSG
jgi:hypothetical protein